MIFIKKKPLQAEAEPDYPGARGRGGPADTKNIAASRQPGARPANGAGQRGSLPTNRRGRGGGGGRDDGGRRRDNDGEH